MKEYCKNCIKIQNNRKKNEAFILFIKNRITPNLSKSIWLDSKEILLALHHKDNISNKRLLGKAIRELYGNKTPLRRRCCDGFQYNIKVLV